MYYLDSNMVIYASGDSGVKGEWCRSVISMIETGSVSACTSYLTFDEYFYKIKKEFSHEDAVRLSEIFLNIANLKFIPVDKKVITTAHHLLTEYPINPRDALHAATAALAGCKFVISEDNDFKRFSFITRKWMEL
ncbi:MAG: tRNA(fMet)-specific endonuclease VapC [Euryarchaeota archaeon ADurb.Bin294]|jgi:predicted nucleic acid-binding protein|nr:MAG: tRNA(fMet)-specific endonuclease VapC [Euryarchaeota archaeon ADurb.Bin294]